MVGCAVMRAWWESVECEGRSGWVWMCAEGGVGMSGRCDGRVCGVGVGGCGGEGGGW